MSREHVYSRAWMAELLPGATSFTNTRAGGEGTAVPLNTWVSSEADVVVRCVCTTCNNGWMDNLDRQAKDVVTSLARGEVNVRVVGPALALLATWAVKMAFVMECLFPRLVVPFEVRDRFRRELVPSTGVRVWVATMNAYEEETRTTPMTLVSAPEQGSVEQAYLATFRILHLVLQILVPLHPDVQPEHYDWGAQRSELAWPRTEPLAWPPPAERMLSSEADYNGLTESFRTRTLGA